MSDKHTPGPWLFSACTRQGFVIWAESGDESVVEAVDDYGRVGPIDSEANARLIAAAPELLEALEDCREALRRAGADGELRVVDTAIAKAKGDA